MLKKLFLFMLFALSVYANIDISSAKVDILPQCSYMIKSSEYLTINQIKKATSDKWLTTKKNSLSTGYHKEKKVWVKCTLKNKNSQTKIKILENDNPHVTYFTLFDANNTKNLGVIFRGKGDDRLTPYFFIKFKPKEVKTIYLHLQSTLGPLNIKPILWNKKEFYKHMYNKYLFIGLFFGAMGALLIYNLFIMFFTRDITYLWYCGYLFGIILHQMYYIGILELDIIKEPIRHRIIINSFIILSLFFMPLFTRAFLHTKQYLRKIDPILKYMPFYFIAVFLVQKPQLMMILLVPVAFVFIFIAVVAYIKKIPQSNYYVLGWLSISTGLMLMGLYNLGYAQFMSKIPYIIQTSIIFEALIFSIGLANRINQLKQEKTMADIKLIQLQKEEKKKLEKIVEIRTRELSSALQDKETLFKELHHRVKNNLQMIISLIRIQKSKITNKKHKDVFISMQNRISSIGTLHDLLYKKNNLANISTKKYFNQIILEIQDSYYDAKNIDISLEVSTNIPLEQITYCGLIINELVTNSIKYAFNNKKERKIDISLSKTGDSFLLSVGDNGKGFDVGKDNNTMGLSVVKTLVKRQLKGSFFMNATSGMQCKITFK